ncbi:MAG: hypothetical protein II882_08820 [Lachnospiraceae bacterium]|nr:hypothetical protein [Lachnospiraceae bacterium]
MVWIIIALVGICAGSAVYFGFKAAEIPQEEKETKTYYVRITAILTGISLILQSLLVVAM